MAQKHFHLLVKAAGTRRAAVGSHKYIKRVPLAGGGYRYVYHDPKRFRTTGKITAPLDVNTPQGQKTYVQNLARAQQTLVEVRDDVASAQKHIKRGEVRDARTYLIYAEQKVKTWAEDTEAAVGEAVSSGMPPKEREILKQQFAGVENTLTSVVDTAKKALPPKGEGGDIRHITKKSFSLEALNKAAGGRPHKYVKRIAKPGGGYRYVYAEPGGEKQEKPSGKLSAFEERAGFRVAQPLGWAIKEHGLTAAEGKDLMQRFSQHMPHFKMTSNPEKNRDRAAMIFNHWAEGAKMDRKRKAKEGGAKGQPHSVWASAVAAQLGRDIGLPEGSLWVPPVARRIEKLVTSGKMTRDEALAETRFSLGLSTKKQETKKSFEEREGERIAKAVTGARPHKYLKRTPKAGGGYRYEYDEPKGEKGERDRVQNISNLLGRAKKEHKEGSESISDTAIKVAYEESISHNVEVTNEINDMQRAGKMTPESVAVAKNALLARTKIIGNKIRSIENEIKQSREDRVSELKMLRSDLSGTMLNLVPRIQATARLAQKHLEAGREKAAASHVKKAGKLIDEAKNKHNTMVDSAYKEGKISNAHYREHQEEINEQIINMPALKPLDDVRDKLRSGEHKKAGLKIDEKARKELLTGKKKLAYGTKTKKWHVIGKKDRDWATGITLREFETKGEATARAKYLGPSMGKSFTEENMNDGLSLAEREGARIGAEVRGEEESLVEKLVKAAVPEGEKMEKAVLEVPVHGKTKKKNIPDERLLDIFNAHVRTEYRNASQYGGGTNAQNIYDRVLSGAEYNHYVEPALGVLEERGTPFSIEYVKLCIQEIEDAQKEAGNVAPEPTAPSSIAASGG